MNPVWFALMFVALVLGAMFLGIMAVGRELRSRRENPYKMSGGMRSVAGTALATSSVFLLVVAVMINEPPLFYMGTAVLATLGASRLQAYLSVRGLRFERFVPERATVGEVVTVELVVWSEQRIRRPLVTVVDHVPSRAVPIERTASLPIAPAFDVPIRTQYRFRPMRRGRFKWSRLEVFGTDALGLVTMQKSYSINPSEILVVPTPLPLDLDLPAASGWGIAETESGSGRGSGIEPRGVRDYSFGDSIRYIHWPSTARSGRLMVKEFETGHHASVFFVPQQTEKTDIGEGKDTSLERMCGHMAYLSDRMLRQGAQVSLPTLEVDRITTSSPHERHQEILVALAEAESNRPESIGQELLRISPTVAHGTLVYVFLAVADPELPGAIRQVVGRGARVTVLLYDVTEFETKKNRLVGQLPATHPEYVGQLRSSGATAVDVPRGKGK